MISDSRVTELWVRTQNVKRRNLEQRLTLQVIERMRVAEAALVDTALEYHDVSIEVAKKRAEQRLRAERIIR